MANDFVVVVGWPDVEDGAYEVKQRYPDGDVRVVVDGVEHVVAKENWLECEE